MRTTRRSVIWIDRLARFTIIVGGIGTILAVSLVCVYLVLVVLPLFRSESITAAGSVRWQPLASSPAAAEPAAQPAAEPVAQPGADPVAPQALVVDEYGVLGWLVSPEGQLQIVQLNTGQILAQRALFADQQPVAWSSIARDGRFAVALADRRIQLGQIRFSTSFLAGEDAQQAAGLLQSDTGVPFRGGIVQRTPEGQLRLQQVTVELEEPVDIELDAAPVLMDASLTEAKTVFMVVSAAGQLRMTEVTRRKNLMTGKTAVKLKQGTLQLDLGGVRSTENAAAETTATENAAAGTAATGTTAAENGTDVAPASPSPTVATGQPGAPELPAFGLLSGQGDAVYLIWPQGKLQRVDSRNVTQPKVVETVALLPDSTQRVTAVEFLNGKASLVIGDSQGNVSIWFRTKPTERRTDDGVAEDGARLVKAHVLQGGSSPIGDITASIRSRAFATLDDSGEVRVYHATSEQLLASTSLGESVGPQPTMALAPRDDLIYAAGPVGINRWQLHAPHPQITMGTIFGKVWYEDYERPEYVWQSSSGTDDFEEKYGLMPLIFGTLKATFYSMMFGAPLAFLAAIYTSEFMHPRVKARVKPTIEIMASLPSVVLGFLSALVFAPVIEDHVPETLMILVCVPFTYLFAAYLWQLLPRTWATRFKGYRLLVMTFVLPLGLLLAWELGPLVERWLFAGDTKAWLDGRVGTGLGAWMMLVLPWAVLVIGWLSIVQVTPWMRRWLGDGSAFLFATWDLVRFLVSCVLVIAVAYGVADLLASTGWDPRGTFVDTYVQRNALVVGFMMGFAIIPIIYTISDDALGAVPESLRAGSLGAGATPWQTAIRVVIPTAMSGLFSAFMVGLGRAVGETMIVLMAAGNTPLMDWNIFNGFRTLSANIAVELPEAAAGSTHYRMLFLAALVLFSITFVINTVAEIVRNRFRKRAFQL